MKATLTKLFLSCIVLVLIISTTALGVLFFLKTNEANNLAADLKIARDDLANAEALVKGNDGGSTPEQTPELLTFEDTGFEFDLKYPSSWTMEAESKINQEVSGVYPEIQSYTLTFTKSGKEVLTFNKILGGVGDLGSSYPADRFDVKEVNAKVIRVSEKGKNQWRYVAKIACGDVGTDVGVPAPTAGTACGATSFFPNNAFGTFGAVTVSLDAADTNSINEADQIILSLF